MKNLEKVIRTDKRTPKAGILSSNLKITYFQVFDGNSFFQFSRSILSQKNIQKNKLRQSTSKKQLKIFKFEDKIPAFSARLSAPSCSFVRHQAFIIFKYSKHNISSTLIIFLINYCRKAILNVFLAGLFPFSDFFTFFGQKWPFSGGQTLSKLQNVRYLAILDQHV
jgi:hypothetical protein